MDIILLKLKLDKSIGFQVEIESCADGYEENGNKEVLPCSHTSQGSNGNYTLSGCEPIVCDNYQTLPEGYQFNNSSPLVLDKSVGFQVDVKCAVDYGQNEKYCRTEQQIENGTKGDQCTSDDDCLNTSTCVSFVSTENKLVNAEVIPCTTSGQKYNLIGCEKIECFLPSNLDSNYYECFREEEGVYIKEPCNISENSSSTCFTNDRVTYNGHIVNNSEICNFLHNSDNGTELKCDIDNGWVWSVHNNSPVIDTTPCSDTGYFDINNECKKVLCESPIDFTKYKVEKCVRDEKQIPFVGGTCQEDAIVVQVLDNDYIEINNNMNSSYYHISCNDGYTNSTTSWSPSITSCINNDNFGSKGEHISTETNFPGHNLDVLKYQLDGCEPIMCQLPSTTPGYTITNSNLELPNFNVTAQCADGYHLEDEISPVVYPCTNDNREITLAGCSENVCTLNNNIRNQLGINIRGNNDIHSIQQTNFNANFNLNDIPANTGVLQCDDGYQNLDRVEGGTYLPECNENDSGWTIKHNGNVVTDITTLCQPIICTNFLVNQIEVPSDGIVCVDDDGQTVGVPDNGTCQNGTRIKKYNIVITQLNKTNGFNVVVTCNREEGFASNEPLDIQSCDANNSPFKLNGSDCIKMNKCNGNQELLINGKNYELTDQYCNIEYDNDTNGFIASICPPVPTLNNDSSTICYSSGTECPNYCKTKPDSVDNEDEDGCVKQGCEWDSHSDECNFIGHLLLRDIDIFSTNSGVNDIKADFVCKDNYEYGGFRGSNASIPYEKIECNSDSKYKITEGCTEITCTKPCQHYDQNNCNLDPQCIFYYGGCHTVGYNLPQDDTIVTSNLKTGTHDELELECSNGFVGTPQIDNCNIIELVPGDYEYTDNVLTITNNNKKIDGKNFIVYYNSYVTHGTRILDGTDLLEGSKRISINFGSDVPTESIKIYNKDYEYHLSGCTCPPGKFINSIGECIECSVNTYSTSVNTKGQCTPAEKGYIPNEGKTDQIIWTPRYGDVCEHIVDNGSCDYYVGCTSSDQSSSDQSSENKCVDRCSTIEYYNQCNNQRFCNWESETNSCKSKYLIRPYEDINSNEINPIYRDIELYNNVSINGISGISHDLNFMCPTHAIRDGNVELPIGSTSLPKCKLCQEATSYALIDNDNVMRNQGYYDIDYNKNYKGENIKEQWDPSKFINNNNQFINSECVNEIVNSIGDYNDLYFINNYNSHDIINDQSFQEKISNNRIRALKLNYDNGIYNYQCSPGFFKPSDPSDPSDPSVATFSINDNQYRQINHNCIENKCNLESDNLPNEYILPQGVSSHSFNLDNTFYSNFNDENNNIINRVNIQCSEDYSKDTSKDTSIEFYCNSPELSEGRIIYDNVKLIGCCPTVADGSEEAETQCFNGASELIQPFTVGGQTAVSEPDVTSTETASVIQQPITVCIDGYYYVSANNSCISKHNIENSEPPLDCPAYNNDCNDIPDTPSQANCILTVCGDDCTLNSIDGHCNPCEIPENSRSKCASSNNICRHESCLNINTEDGCNSMSNCGIDNNEPCFWNDYTTTCTNANNTNIINDKHYRCTGNNEGKPCNHDYECGTDGTDGTCNLLVPISVCKNGYYLDENSGKCVKEIILQTLINSNPIASFINDNKYYNISYFDDKVEITDFNNLPTDICNDSYYLHTDKCMSVSACGDEYYESVAPTATTDRQCSPCTDIPNSKPGVPITCTDSTDSTFVHQNVDNCQFGYIIIGNNQCNLADCNEYDNNESGCNNRLDCIYSENNCVLRSDIRPSWCGEKKLIQPGINCSDYNYNQGLCDDTWYITDSTNDKGSFCIYNQYTNLCENNDDDYYFNNSDSVCNFTLQVQIPQLCRNKNKSRIPCQEQSYRNCENVWVDTNEFKGICSRNQGDQCVNNEQISVITDCTTAELTTPIDDRCNFSKKQIKIDNNEHVSPNNIPPSGFDLCKLIYINEENDGCSNYWYQKDGNAYLCTDDDNQGDINQCVKDNTYVLLDLCNNNNIVNQFDLKPDFCKDTELEDKCFIGFRCNSRKDQEECVKAWYSTQDTFQDDKTKGNSCFWDGNQCIENVTNTNEFYTYGCTFEECDINTCQGRRAPVYKEENDELNEDCNKPITCFQQGNHGNQRCNELSQKILSEHCPDENNCTLPENPAYCANKNNNNQAIPLKEGVCKWKSGTKINEVELSYEIMYPSKNECNSRFTYGGIKAELGDDGPKQCMWNDSPRHDLPDDKQIAAFGGTCVSRFKVDDDPNMFTGDVNCSTDRYGYEGEKAPPCRDIKDNNNVTIWETGDINCECDGDRWLQEHRCPRGNCNNTPEWRCLNNSIEREDNNYNEYPNDWRFGRMRKEEEQYSPYREPTLDCSNKAHLWSGTPYSWEPTTCRLR